MKISQKLFAVALLTAAVALVSFCGGKQRLAEKKAGTIDYPRRIVSLEPSITETLFALGLREEIVGVTNFCRYPPEAVEKAKVGGYSEINIETLIDLEPDLVIATRRHNEAIGKLKELKIEYLIIENDTVGQIVQSILDIGKAAGRMKTAKLIVAKMKAKIRNAGNRVLGDAHPRAVIVVGRNPGTMQSLFVAGKKTYLNELLELGGLRNVFNDAETSWPQPSLEEMIYRNPEVIIETRGGTELSGREVEKIKKEWGALGDIDAVRNGRIYVWTEDYILIPGPRIVHILDKIARIAESSDDSS